MNVIEEDIKRIQNDTTKIGDNPPKIRKMFDLVKQGNYTIEDFTNYRKAQKQQIAPEFQSGKWVKFQAGFEDGLKEMAKTPDRIEIWGGQAALSIGGIAGSETVENFGKSLINSAYHEIEEQDKQWRKKALQLAPSEYDDFSYALGGGMANYGGMLALSYLTGGLGSAAGVTAKTAGTMAEAAGIGSVFALELGSEAQEKIDTYIQKTGDVDLKEYTSDIASKDFMFSAMYAAGSAILEKKFGFGEQRKLFKMPAGERLKNIGKTMLSEGGTEFAQSLYDMGIDLAGGYIDFSKLPERFMQALQEGAVGAVLGGGAGTAAAINHRSQAKAILREDFKKTVPTKDLDEVVDAVYEKSDGTIRSVIAQELIHSEELRNKHGVVFQNMYNAALAEVNKARKQGGYPDLRTEEDVAAYVNEESRKFADWTLAEAQRRGVVIGDVLEASSIYSDETGLHIGMTKDTVSAQIKETIKKKKRKATSLVQFLRQSGGVRDDGGELRGMDAQKTHIGLINKNGISLDEAGEKLWNAGYFMERPTPAEVLDAIDDELRGNRKYPLDYVEEEEVSDADAEAMLDDSISDYAEAMGYDLKGMSFEEKAQIYDQMQRNMSQADEEYLELAQEMERLDDLYPAYEGETITINGQEKTVYNSNGDRIAKSEQALRNFYKWFGDSKVVDEQGRPLVVYHGTNAEFDIFDVKKQGKNDTVFFGRGFYFTPNKKVAEHYANNKIVMPVYLNIKNPLDLSDLAYKQINEIGIDKLKELGIYTKEAKDFIENPVEIIKNGKPVKETTILENYIAEGKLGKKLSDNAKKQGFDGVIVKGKEYVAFEPNQIKSTSNRGTYSLDEDNIYYQFAGENALTAALDELNKAKQLAADGVDNEKIRQQTGWFKGVDGKWRFEISDEDAKMLGTIEELLKKNEDKHEKTLKKLAKLEKEREKLRIAVNKNEITENEYYSKLEENDKKIQTLMDNDEGFRIRDIMKHDKLYEAYPFIANINVFISERIDPDEAYYNRKSQSITVGTNVAKEPASSINLKGIILHEIQHAIQATEGFARGGSPDEFESMEQLRRGLQQAKELLSEANEAIEQAEDLGYSDDTEINGKSVSFYKEQKADAQEQIDYANERISNYKDPYQKYKSLYGEIEARNTAIRSEFTEELRGKISPERTQDIKNADAIVVFGDGTAMAYEPEVIQKFYQRGKSTRGSIQFKGQEAIIRLTESVNASTLAHELAHYYLQNTFLYSKSGLASPEYSTYFKPIADYLGIDSNQETIKEWQQEKFARAYEQYLLKGKAENPELQAAFNNYNKWIKRAYRMLKLKPKYRNEEGKLVEPRLTPEIMDAFGKLTGGFVARPDIEAMAETVTPELENAVVEYENQVTQEQERIQKETVYPTTEIRETAEEGTTGKSGVAFRVLGEELGYDVKHIEDQMEKAREFVKKNLSEAKEIVNGKQAPEGMLSSAINLAYVEVMENSGNYQEAERATRIRSMEQTRRGQEIAMEKATTDNILNAETWSNLVLSRKSAEAARKYFKNDLKALQDFIKRESANIAKQIVNKPKEERAAIIKENLERITQETGILFQEDYSDLEDSDYYNEVLNETQLMIEKSMGIGLDEDQIDYIHDNVRQLQDIVKETVSNNGNISIEAFKQIRKMYDTIESYTPSSNVAVWSSIIGRGAMLASIKSPILNIISNAENMITETLSRKALNIVTGQSNDNIVDSNIVNDYLKWSYNVYQASGYMPSVTSDILGGRPILGEKRLTSQGKGKVRAIGRFAEDIVFKELMGLPDSISKDLSFVSVAGNKATQQAYKEGLSGDKAKARANELFKDAILLRPMTEEGERIRNESMAAAHEATFTQDSEISKIALRIRDVLNSKEFKAGDFLVPFVKTPANVVALGMEYSLGSIYTVYHIKDIINNPQSDISQAAIKAGVRNGIGMILAMMLAGLVDDDDYIPEYDNASPKQRDIAKLKNAPFNSIRIGNKWINLDYFGPLAIPMAGILTARAKQDLTGFLQGVSGQALKTPGVKEINSLIGDVTRAVQYGVSYKKIAEDVFNWGVEQTASRTIPAIITDFGKLIDKYERETGGEMARRVMAKIPVLREELPIKTDITGRKIETEPTNILFGSRVKTAVDDAVVKEIDRLNKAGNAPTISDPTRYGYFRSLETEEKDKIRAKFNQEYGRKAREKIASSAYKRLDDAQKKKELNKIRKKISDDLKKQK